MEKQRNSQMIIIGILAVAVLTMSVGFAAYTQTLDFTGSAAVTGASWKINFLPETYAESAGSVTVDAANRTIDGTSVTYAVSLEKPGDFYEFSLDVKNAGTFDADLTGITMTALTTAQQKYLTYTINYDGTDYTSSASSLTVSLDPNVTKTVKVRVEYIYPEDPEDLPSTVTIPLTASLTYTQD